MLYLDYRRCELVTFNVKCSLKEVSIEKVNFIKTKDYYFYDAWSQCLSYLEAVTSGALPEDCFIFFPLILHSAVSQVEGQGQAVILSWITIQA